MGSTVLPRRCSAKMGSSSTHTDALSTNATCLTSLTAPVVKNFNLLGPSTTAREDTVSSTTEKKACNLILSCVDGEENTFTCPGDLVFESNKGVCVWPEDSTRDGCTRTHEATALADGFKCPTTKQFYGDGTEETNPRYTHPRSCQMFYLCMNGLYPREQSCPTNWLSTPRPESA